MEFQIKRYADWDEKSDALDLIPGWLNFAEQQNVVGAYLATWIAFNAVYVAEYPGQYASFIEQDGKKQSVNRCNYGYQMVKVNTVSERDMVQHALKELPPEYKRRLVTLPSPVEGLDDTCLGFFARRTPVWQGFEIHQDKSGQRVNGVVNLRETISKEYPRWIPVDQDLLDAFLDQVNAGVMATVPKRLIEQTGDVLYTVRNNLFHGCKGTDDSNDRQVLHNALAMLSVIVEFYAQ